MQGREDLVLCHSPPFRWRLPGSWEDPPGKICFLVSHWVSYACLSIYFAKLLYIVGGFLVIPSSEVTQAAIYLQLLCFSPVAHMCNFSTRMTGSEGQVLEMLLRKGLIISVLALMRHRLWAVLRGAVSVMAPLIGL